MHAALQAATTVSDQPQLPNEVRVYVELRQTSGEWRFCSEILVTEPEAVNLLLTLPENYDHLRFSHYVEAAYRNGIPSHVLMGTTDDLNRLGSEYLDKVGTAAQRYSIDLECIHEVMSTIGRMFHKTARAVVFIHMDPPPQF